MEGEQIGDALHIDGNRLWSRLEALGEIGTVIGPGGARGVNRLALSDADGAGRDLVVAWMEDLGLEVRVDAVGNVVAHYPGSDPSLAPVMCGSHIDTVATGGRFDGNLGVLGGLEVVETLASRGIRPPRGIEVAFFTNEEGSRFAPDMLGSLVYVGGLDLETALDTVAVDGAVLGTELLRLGYAGPHPCPAAAFPHAYVELHIEQGPVLEAAGVTIGAVTGVQGISWHRWTIGGRSAHAGTTPMSHRRDPMVVAAAAVGEARRLTGELGGAQVATVGRLEVRPNLVNVVPDEVVFTVDLRNTDETVLREAEVRLAAFIGATTSAEGCRWHAERLARFEPVAFDEATIDLVESTARRLGHSTMRLPSGAGHDAQMLARVCPTAMIFVPSVGGLSHNLAEYTTPEHVAAGADVLLHTLLALAAA